MTPRGYKAAPMLSTALLLGLLLVPLAAAAQGPGAAEVRRLTSTVTAYPFPAPDGSRIVFQSNVTGNFELYVANADGRARQRLSELPGDKVTPVWSPDGRWIAFAANPEGQSEIFVIAADGTGLRRVTDHPGDDSHPHWSADGMRIFFNSARGTPDLTAPWASQWHDIYSMRPDGSDIRRHTNCRSVCTYGSPSPDGRRIVFRKTIDGPGMSWDLTLGSRNSEVFVADLDGSNERNLSRSAAFDGWPRWSPDGSLVVFASNRAGPAGTGQIFLASVDGGTITQVTRGRWSHVQPAWSPDGRKLYVYQVDESEGDEFGNVAVIELQPDLPTS